MNIKPITPAKINYLEIKQRKNKQKDTSKNNIKKTIIITGAISAAALTGMLIVKKTNLLNKISDLVKKQSQTPNNSEFVDSFCKKSNEPKIIKRTLPNGVEKIDKIDKSNLYGTIQKTKLSRPVNGVKTLETFVFPNGDISQISAFDTSGNLIKNVHYNRNYSTRNGLENIIVSTSNGETQIDYEYLRHLPEKIKSVKISYPDGTEKLTSIPLSIKDKLADLIHR